MFFIIQLWGKRQLIVQLVIKELKVRYSTVSLGFVWALLSPLLITGVLYLVFFCFLHITIPEAPFLLYLMSATFTWKFFQDSVQGATTCLLDNRALLKDSVLEHYFIPVTVVIVNAIMFLPALFLLVALSWFMAGGLALSIILLPIVFLLHVGSTAGLAVILSIVYVRWRDIKYVLEPLLALLFYLTPVFYSFSLVATFNLKGFYSAYIANPLVGILTFYRVALIKGYYQHIRDFMGDFFIFVVPFVFTVISLIAAEFVYKRNRHIINDFIGY